MATYIINQGSYRWRMTRDEAGYREYQLGIRVMAEPEDGPANVLRTPGLPVPGYPWAIRNDFDFWAWCRANCTVDPEADDDGEPTQVWGLGFTFSNKPPTPQNNRCHDQEITDPLLEPQKVSGGSTRFQKEAQYDRFGNPIINSAFELIRGPNVEFDANRPTVRIEQNVINLQLGLLASMVDSINDAPLWGLDQYRIKFSNYTWDRKYYKLCSIYYTRVLDFEITFDSWDRDVLDEGTKALRGHWGLGGAEGDGWVLDDIGGQPPDPFNPGHFDKYLDRKGTPGRCILDGLGVPIEAVADAGAIHVEYYPSTNFLLLGVPLTF